MGSLIDMTGKHFGRLTVLGRSESQYALQHPNKVYWDCLCDCGNTKIVEGYNLRNGCVRSCGCLFSDSVTTHGESKSRLYKVWSSMKARCGNKNDRAYRFYGGKGVSVCSEWLSYENFAQWAKSSGYHVGLCIDRIDSSKNYCPENCRWITQSENSSRTATRLLTVNGTTLNYRQWQERIGMGKMSVAHWVERHGEEYAVKRIAAMLNPQDFSEGEIGALGIGKNKRRYATINGETLSFSAWAKRIGMTHTGVLHWVKEYGEDYAIQRIKSHLAAMGE